MQTVFSTKNAFQSKTVRYQNMLTFNKNYNTKKNLISFFFFFTAFIPILLSRVDVVCSAVNSEGGASVGEFAATERVIRP